MVASQAQVRLDRTGFAGNLGSNLSGKDARTISESPAGPDDSRGWLMALVAVLLIGHQLRRKHRFLRPQRFSDL
jgi:MYXO-CTERM domain-containing protein